MSTLSAESAATSSTPAASVDRNRLAQEAARLYDAIDRSQAIIQFDLDGRVFTANRNFQQVLGYTHADVLDTLAVFGMPVCEHRAVVLGLPRAPDPGAAGDK